MNTKKIKKSSSNGGGGDDDRALFQKNESTAIPKSLEKKIRVAKAQSEIDRILSGPDAPFDAETELKRVVSLHPPPVLDESESSYENENSSSNNESENSSISTASSTTATTSSSTLQEELLLRQEEAVCHELETELYEAVKQQDYETAARKRESLNQLHMDDSLSVLQVNAAFYRAFSLKDAELMQSLWLQDDTATCIHPASPPLVGAHAVGRAWRQMFASRQGSFQRSWIEPAHIRVVVRGSATAVLTCDERVYARRFVRGRRRQTERVNTLTATNIFRRVAGRWYLVHHHASWHAESEAARRALQQQQQAASLSSGSSSKRRTTNIERKNGNNNPDISMDGMLGMNNFGPLLGDSPPKQQEPPQRRKIVMGNLSDILNGSLDDLFSQDGNIINRSDAAGGGSNNGDQDGGEAVIRIRRIENNDDEDDDVDDEDEDDDHLDLVLGEDDDEDHGVEDDTSEETVSIIKEWAESGEKKRNHNKTQNDASNQRRNRRGQQQPPPSVRQRCISSLRHLCNRGSISPKQKRVLLTDIVSCSARGETSMVEVAYELLCSEMTMEAADDVNVSDSDDAEEEFADQCRVLAETLPDSHVTTSNRSM